MQKYKILNTCDICTSIEIQKNNSDCIRKFLNTHKLQFLAGAPKKEKKEKVYSTCCVEYKPHETA